MLLPAKSTALQFRRQHGNFDGHEDSGHRWPPDRDAFARSSFRQPRSSKQLTMAETLGTLADKLTTVKLKLWHTDDPERTRSLELQEAQLQNEIDEFVAAAVLGNIPIDKLTFAANKVYKKEGNIVPELQGTIGARFSQLAEVNCRLWHVQERVYEFEQVAMEEKDEVIKQLAIVNLQRNQCIDQLDAEFRKSIQNLRKK